ncbi:MAG: hypothetical protein M1817_000215 [Caeruleum heppii]|nr:MAG: hypothetical protein M1817_000215 [Caeruleum heppii]
MSAIFFYAGWTLLPNLVTGWVQSLYYGLTIRAGDPKPQPGSPRWNTHRRRIQIVVIAAYLLYTIVETDWEIRRAGDFYQDLGVTPDVDDRGIKSRFRRLAALHHPDKISSAAPDSRASSESYFVHLKQAQDTLLDPTKRFAYDRFGPDSTSWRHCSSVRDYLLLGMENAAPYYVGGGVFMLLLGWTGYLEWGCYWRYIIFASLALFEFSTITRPYTLPVLTSFLNPLISKLTAHPPYVPFQSLILIRKLVLTLFIAFSQLGPLLSEPAPSPTPATKPASAKDHEAQQLSRLAGLTAATDFEATRLLGLEMSPFAGDDEGLGRVRGRMQEWLVQNTVRADPEVRDAVGRVLVRKRREGAPQGARGTK